MATERHQASDAVPTTPPDDHAAPDTCGLLSLQTTEIFPIVKPRQPISANPPAADRTAPSRRVLIVHGQPKLRRLWRELLNTVEDTEVLEAADAHEVFSRHWAKPPDVVVVPFELPGLNGIEFAREIAKRSPVVEVIICGGH